MGTISRTAGALAVFTFIATAQQYLISTVAGGPPAAVPQPHDSAIGFPIAVTTDAALNIYFSSGAVNAVFRLDPGGSVTRVAGNTIAGYAGDGGQATNAELSLGLVLGFAGPGGIAVDRVGNIFIADTGNHRIRRVSASGVIATVAGNGNFGSTGDGGPAVDATLEWPVGIAADSAGNLYVADRGTNSIRRISTDGIIATVAGNGRAGYSGDGGSATEATLGGPNGLTIDRSGNLFIADSYNNRIRKVTPDGIISTVAQLPYPIAVTTDSTGNLLAVQLDSGARLVRISPDQTISTIAGGDASGFYGDGGPAASAGLWNPFAVALDASGAIYIADTANNRIRKISPEGIISTIAGTGDPASAYSGDGGPARGASLLLPWGVAVDSRGTLFISDSGANRIRQVSQDGTITTIAGTGEYGFSGDGGPAKQARLSGPFGLTLDGAGNLYFIDGSRIRRVSPDGSIQTVAGTDKSGFSGDGGPATSALLGAFSSCNTICGGLAADRSGNLFIADVDNNRVRKVSTEGIITTVAGNGTFGHSSNGGRATDAEIAPTGVAVDNSGNLFIADFGGYVLKAPPDGTIATVAGNGLFAGPSGDGGPALNARLSAPSSLAVDGQGNLFIADPGWNFYTGDAPVQTCCDHRVRRISPDGTITTVAGYGTAGYSGDGGPATTAALNGPVAVAVNGSGMVYVADPGNRAIRMLEPAGPLVMAAVLDIASREPGPVAPGKIVLVRGAGLGPSDGVQNQPVNGRFGAELAGTTVTFDGIAAPVLAASGTGITVVVPYEVAGTATQVIATYQGTHSAPLSVAVAPSAPSLFTADGSGVGQLLAVNASNGTPNSAANPVRIGEYLTMYATGEGQTIPAGVDGVVVSASGSRPVLPLRVEVDGITASIEYAGGAPGEVSGLMQINVQIPAGVRPGGYVQVTVRVGNASTQPDSVWIAISGG
jgi:uncharacterized protein (TIGR03437 family)